MTYSKEILKLSETLKSSNDAIPRKLRIVLKDYAYDNAFPRSCWPKFSDAGAFLEPSKTGGWANVCRNWLHFVALSEADLEEASHLKKSSVNNVSKVKIVSGKRIPVAVGRAIEAYGNACRDTAWKGEVSDSQGSEEAFEVAEVLAEKKLLMEIGHALVRTGKAKTVQPAQIVKTPNSFNRGILGGTGC
jgi:hypothetical protein